MKKEWKEPYIEVLNFKNTYGRGGGGHGGNYNPHGNPHMPGGFYPPGHCWPPHHNGGNGDFNGEVTGS
ncbi:hypothetical protein ACQPUL_06700 [Clostridium butyricum]|uniref:Uncharacterized protein n=1 Tax=Clostridium butyricum TaxID=1492 RepID=A0A6N3G562_CLOBU|nr:MULTISPECIES: hypothetical protein [Clostridium]ALP90954.1 hypothetical protein ATN24_12665 [Clostridium butyricum]ALS17483.1 hypothetical protein ATD26_11575 [Clostridium butyricum]ANF14577.1 hypothetical protein AZ909_11115 [Clostridium butyricum]AOR94641.1 hypothetical protein BBB49_11295 [Clostridium butyricum]MBO1686314.1 hypothetical protein [Clostridium butyricum]